MVCRQRIVSVHPTQLYEAFALAVVAWCLVRWRRRDVADALVLGRYLMLAASIRFAIEFIRVNVRLVGPFTLAHLVSLALVIIGAGLVLVTLALASLLGVAMLSIPVYFTGEPAREAIARQASVPAEVVERHAQAAQFAFFAVEWVGTLALAGLWLVRTEPAPRWFLAILLAGSVLTAGVMVYTANEGRQIRHPNLTSHSRA